MFVRLNGELACEEVLLAELAAAYGTPLFVYSQAAIAAAWAAYQRGIAAAHYQGEVGIFYAVKANSNLAILRLLAGWGAGFDTVSRGELERALLAGAQPQQLVFSGVGKTRDELEFAVRQGVGSICLESEPEFVRLCEICEELQQSANLAVRINPAIEAKTHPSIQTGGSSHKFGVTAESGMELLRTAAQQPYINLSGLSCHLGSQILEIDPFLAAARQLRGIYDELAATGIKLKRLSLGGGFGVSYRHGEEQTLDPAACAALLEIFAGTELQLLLEPGRSLVAAAGVLLTRVEYLKQAADKNFAIVDAGMNDLLRPSLYDAYHEVLLVRAAAAAAATRTYDLAGPVCESTDVLARARDLVLKPGELLAFMDAGAYAMAMSSNYNTRPRPAEVLVAGRQATLIRRREDLADMLSCEQGLDA